MDMPRRLGAEFFGTFWLTFAGCGSAVLAAGFPALGIGFLGVSFAFGLTVLTMAYAVGHISGGHFNCAVTVGLWAGGRFKTRDVIPYMIAQVLGRRGSLRDRLGQARLGTRGVCFQRLWESQPRQIWFGVLLPDRSHRHFFLLVCNHRYHLEGGGCRLCRHPHRALPHAHSPLPYPGHERLGQSGAEHWAGPICRQCLYGSALAVLARTDLRRSHCRRGGPLAARSARCRLSVYRPITD